MRFRLLLMALITAFGVLTNAGLQAAVAPVSPEAAPPPARQDGPGESTAPAQPSGPQCVVAGTVFCSEYGSRFRDTLMLVLADGPAVFVSSISDTNGSFALPAPCGRSFELSIAFGEKLMPLGSLELPDAPDGTVYTLEIRHTGSYLELVRDVRNGIYEDDITYRLIER